MPHHGLRSSFENRRRTAAGHQRSPFDDPVRHAPGSTTFAASSFDDAPSCRLDITFRARLSTLTLVLA